MGELEKKSRKLGNKPRKRQAKRNVSTIVLKTVAAAGVLSIGLIAPNVIGAMHKLGLLSNPRDILIINSSAERLRRKGLLERTPGGYRLTESGRGVLMRWTLADYKINSSIEWDGKWRVIIFDIPEKLKQTRERIRVYLSGAGFRHLQDSVWIYPYDCEDIMGLLKTDYGVSKYMLCLIVEQLENDERLRGEFVLS